MCEVSQVCPLPIYYLNTEILLFYLLTNILSQTQKSANNLFHHCSFITFEHIYNASPLSFYHNIHTTRRFKTEILILTLCFTSLRKIDLQKKMTNTWHLSTTHFLSILWSMHPHHPKKNKLRTTPLNFKLSIYHPLCNPRSLTPYPTQFNIYRTSPPPPPHPNFPPCWI